MGLDMYLTKRTYVGAQFAHNKVEGELNLTTNGKPIPIKLSRVEYIHEHVGYWRKANHIHKWFVDNCQGGVDDCREADVSEEQLKALLAECKSVKENPLAAADTLPTTAGFFFGGTEYDQYYMQDIDSTIEIIETLLAEKGDGYLDIFYSSSW